MSDDLNDYMNEQHEIREKRDQWKIDAWNNRMMIEQNITKEFTEIANKWKLKINSNEEIYIQIKSWFENYKQYLFPYEERILLEHDLIQTNHEELVYNLIKGSLYIKLRKLINYKEST